MSKQEKNNLKNNLNRLSEISKWFEEQTEVDVEEGLNKTKEAVKLVKESKKRLKEVENQFAEIKKEIDIENEKD